MNWLTNFVRPKIRALVRKADVPENLWDKCPSCAKMIFHRDLEANARVCPHCGHHMRLPAKRRLAMLFDEGAFTRIELPASVADPLRFRDQKRYSDRLKDSREKTGEQDAIIVAHGRMGGLPLVAAVFNFEFMGGSMGIAVGDALLAASKLAVLQQAALVVVPASGGARMQEGILSLMQMPRTVLAADEVKEAGLPFIVVLTDPTTGGVSGSLAMVGDNAIAETGAGIGIAGARVIEETIREKLPPGFQRAEYLRDHGMVDIVVHRHQLRDTLIRILSMLMTPGPSAEVLPLPQPALAIPPKEAPGAAKS